MLGVFIGGKCLAGFSRRSLSSVEARERSFVIGDQLLFLHGGRYLANVSLAGGSLQLIELVDLAAGSNADLGGYSVTREGQRLLVSAVSNARELLEVSVFNLGAAGRLVRQTTHRVQSPRINVGSLMLRGRQLVGAASWLVSTHPKAPPRVLPQLFAGDAPPGSIPLPPSRIFKPVALESKEPTDQPALHGIFSATSIGQVPARPRPCSANG